MGYFKNTAKGKHRCYYAPRPAPPSEAMLGWVPFYFCENSDLYQVTTGELLKVTKYTALISSNGCHFLSAWVLVY